MYSLGTRKVALISLISISIVYARVYLHLSLKRGKKKNRIQETFLFEKNVFNSKKRIFIRIKVATSFFKREKIKISPSECKRYKNVLLLAS